MPSRKRAAASSPTKHTARPKRACTQLASIATTSVGAVANMKPAATVATNTRSKTAAGSATSTSKPLTATTKATPKPAAPPAKAKSKAAVVPAKVAAAPTSAKPKPTVATITKAKSKTLAAPRARPAFIELLHEPLELYTFKALRNETVRLQLHELARRYGLWQNLTKLDFIAVLREHWQTRAAANGNGSDNDSGDDSNDIDADSGNEEGSTTTSESNIADTLDDLQLSDQQRQKSYNNTINSPRDGLDASLTTLQRSYWESHNALVQQQLANARLAYAMELAKLSNGNR